MSATHFTIYKLKDGVDWKELIDIFNAEKDADKQFMLKENRQDLIFTNISSYSLYTRAAESDPDWGRTLEGLVTDLPPITNINHSYILFIDVNGTCFAVTGGSGYQVISRDKQFNFGIELLSRLIEQSEMVIRSVKDRYFTGNILGGDYQLKGKGTIHSETDFNNYFNEIRIELKSSVIRTKLGINITTKKADYRFLAKDSIKLGKALTLPELDKLLGAILKLEKEDGYPINPFYQVNRDDSLIGELNNEMTNMFKRYLEDEESETDFVIVPAYHLFDHQFIQIKENEDTKLPYETALDIYEYVKENISLDLANSDILNLIKSIHLIGAIDGEELQINSLYAHFDLKTTWNNKTYWLMNGNWYCLESSFMEEIDEEFEQKIAGEFESDLARDGLTLNNWLDGSETKYNLGHNTHPSIYVLDRILYQNIEICDLLFETDDSLYFIHVKDGLDGKVRILTEQINHARQLISGAKNNDTTMLRGYYESIANKIKNEEESDIALSAKKFIERFSEQDFVDTVIYKEINFVFACRPLESHNFNNAKTIKSTAAKLSMITLIEEKRYDFGLEFVAIKREDIMA